MFCDFVVFSVAWNWHPWLIHNKTTRLANLAAGCSTMPSKFSPIFSHFHVSHTTQPPENESQIVCEGWCHKWSKLLASNDLNLHIFTCVPKLPSSWDVRVQRKSFLKLAIRASWMKLAYTSPNVISTSPKNISWAELILQFFCNLISSKNFTYPLGKLRTKFTSLIAKSTSPGLLDTTFFACSGALPAFLHDTGVPNVVFLSRLTIELRRAWGIRHSPTENFNT